MGPEWRTSWVGPRYARARMRTQESVSGGVTGWSSRGIVGRRCVWLGFGGGLGELVSCGLGGAYEVEWDESEASKVVQEDLVKDESQVCIKAMHGRSFSGILPAFSGGGKAFH